MTHHSDNTWTEDALMRGDIAAIKKRVLDEPNYLLERDYIGNTPLLGVVGAGNLELVKFLLKHGADPNVPVDDGYTCLLTAVESEEEESIAIVSELIQAGADIHKTGINGWTPLHMAAVRGHVEKARLFIQAGAEVNRRTAIDACETPLMEAAGMGHPSTVRLLLEHGADASMRDTVNDRTPLEIARNAAKGPDPNVVDVLNSEFRNVDLDGLFDDMDLPADQLEMMKDMTKDFDMAQSYIEGSSEIAKSGDHSEVIRILSEHGQ